MDRVHACYSSQSSWAISGITKFSTWGQIECEDPARMLRICNCKNAKIRHLPGGGGQRRGVNRPFPGRGQPSFRRPAFRSLSVSQRLQRKRLMSGRWKRLAGVA